MHHLYNLMDSATFNRLDPEERIRRDFDRMQAMQNSNYPGWARTERFRQEDGGLKRLWVTSCGRSEWREVRPTE